MKKIIVPIMGMLLLCLDLTAQNVQYKVNHAGAATTCPPEDVASDFGPRMLPQKDGTLKYDWHGGVDYSPLTGNQDRGYTLLAMENGTISYIHNLAGIGFKYLRVDGVHHYGYGHIFTSKDGIQELGDFKIVKLLAPHAGQLAIYNTQTQTLYHTCRDGGPVLSCSEFKYKDGTDTITATNQVVTGSEIGPMGTSIDGKLPNGNKNPDAAVEAHLHLYNFGTVNNNTASDVADGNTLNPLQFATHTATTYLVSIYKNSGFTQEGIGLVYPGTGSTKAGVRVRMANQNGGGNYSAVMNIDKVKLYISKGDEAYKVLEGLNYESRVDYGGRTDAPDHYPAVNSANVLTKTGEWGTGAAPGVNGIVPKAYRSQPEDDFCFTDFVTRLHKANVPGSPAQYTSCPAEAKYPDGRYKLKARVISISGDSTDSAVSPVLLDNYKPYISQVSMSVKGKQCYDAGWECAPCGGLKYAQSPDSPYSLDTLKVEGMRIRVKTSKPLASLRLTIAFYSKYNLSADAVSADSTEWIFNTGSVTDFNADSARVLRFTGTDLSGNSLLNLSGYKDAACVLPLTTFYA